MTRVMLKLVIRYKFIKEKKWKTVASSSTIRRMWGMTMMTMITIEWHLFTGSNGIIYGTTLPMAFLSLFGFVILLKLQYVLLWSWIRNRAKTWRHITTGGETCWGGAAYWPRECGLARNIDFWLAQISRHNLICLVARKTQQSINQQINLSLNEIELIRKNSRQ